MNNSFLRSIALIGLLLVGLLLIGGTAAHAQFGLAIGPKAGVSISTFRGSDFDNIDNRASWLGGIFINTQISPSVTLQPELIFTKRGAEYSSNGIRSNIEVNYFEVPILAKVRLPIGGLVFPHVFAGPNFSFRTNLNYSSYNTDNQTVITTNDTDIRTSDVGALVGAGVDVQTRGSGVFLTLDGRYGFGFNNLNRGGDDLVIRNAGWYFSAGIGFLLTRDIHDDY